MVPGDLLADKYRLERILGEGATGVVWCATQLDLDRQVAVKVMHPNLAGRSDARLRFLREARVAASLHHPGAVGILDFGEAPAGMFLVMELLHGETLRDRLDRATLPRGLALEIATQIAVVLDAAHQINLVHRDIKPENTFLVSRADAPAGPLTTPLVRVVDFGLAFIADAQTSLGRLTADGILGGTPAYMSPEQARGRAVGPPSDIYSLGCTLYELIAGRPPFMGSVTEVITRHAYAPPLSLRELDLEPTPPAALDELLRTMLSKSPPLRPTAAQVIAALAALAAGDGDGALRLRPRSVRSLPAVAVVTDDDAPAMVLAVEGTLDEDTRLALAAAHIEVAGLGDPRATAVFAPGADLDRLGELAARGVPLVTDVDPGDFAGMAARVRAGCRVAVSRPVAPGTLIARVRRLPGARSPLPTGLAATLVPPPPTPHP